MKKIEWTLANALEHVVAMTEGGQLKELYYKKIADAASYINTVFGVSPRQCYILAVMFNRLGESTSTTDLANFAHANVLSILDMQTELDDLVSKDYILCVDDCHYHKWEQTFMLSDGIIQAVRYNRPFAPLNVSDMTADDVLDTMRVLLHECDYNNISYKAMTSQLWKLIDQTQHIQLCRKLKKLDLHTFEMVMLVIACVTLVVNEKNYISSSDYDDILPKSMQRHIKRCFKANSGRLCKHELMTQDTDDDDDYRLTNKARAELLSEFGVALTQESEETENTPAQPTQANVVMKPMFYNSKERAQIERLENLLTEGTFVKVQARMRDAGMRPGFTAIMYGEPGTGKTETVIQLANRTGRSIIQVSLAALKDKYVGESEKNVQRVFDEYREKMQSSDIAPILLFNEADGIFGKRNTNIQNEVDQMENTIQNIILQNMETFEGIMIATTNLTMNLDGAFERRFLYKIEFHKPSREVREQIWMSLLTGLQREDAKTLAMRYELSGGQIENIARKQMIEGILYDSPIELSKLCSFCEEENFRRKPRNIFENKKVS